MLSDSKAPLSTFHTIPHSPGQRWQPLSMNPHEKVSVKSQRTANMAERLAGVIQGGGAVCAGAPGLYLLQGQLGVGACN